MIMMSDFFDTFKKWMEFDAEKDFYNKHFPSLSENPEVIFREMKKADLKHIMEIEKSVYEFPWEPITFMDCLKADYGCWVALKLDRIIGYGILTVGAGESHIVNICVSQEAQGRGMGRMMLNKLMDEARRQRAEMMILEVRPSNTRAIKLYLSMGFNEIGTRKGYYPAKGGKEDALVLACML